MPKSNYDHISEIFEKEHQTVSGQMFGKPCLKSKKKAFVAFFQDEMIFKLGQESIKFLKEELVGSQNWDPSGKGRAMKDWLQVPYDYSEKWESLATEALMFTAPKI